ncbi:YceI family protein [Bdellovibrio sp. HCB337]|uniref:YceI family protein n=1 Tax=Bdellovibrio sp. HCB337 TaxID=3394358 RepID=UPI0039A59582
MKKQLSLFVLVGFLSSLSYAGSVTVDVTLNPAGSFKAKTSDIKGTATVKGDEISASNIAVPLKGIKTGVELRDKHTLKHLEADKYPEAVLVSATGKGGKGTGKIKIKGIEKDIAGTYKISGNNVEAEFDLNLPDFKITGISYMGVGVEDKVTLHIVMPIKK